MISTRYFHYWIVFGIHNWGVENVESKFQIWTFTWPGSCCFIISSAVGWIVVSTPKDISSQNLLWTWPYLEKRSLQISLLRISKWDGLGWTLSAMTSLCKRIKGETDPEAQGDGHVKREAEIGVMLPQAKERWEPPEAGRGKEGFSPRAFEGTRPHWHFDFRVPASRTVREHISVVLSRPVCGTSLQQLQETNIPSISLKWGPLLLAGSPPVSHILGD